MLNLNKQAKLNLNLEQHSTVKLLTLVCVSLCTTVVHNTTENSSDSLLSSHCSDDAIAGEG